MAKGKRDPRARVLAAFAACTILVCGVVAGAPAARAEPGGVDQKPVMGWSSWSFLRFGINRANIEAEAHAIVTSGLAAVGYKYVNIDDNWYQCPGPQGPDVDQYGRWLINTSEFPNAGATSGIESVARYVHGLGLKFGIYETAGISKQAVAENTRVLGTSYTADQIATTRTQANYNCGGMVDLNYPDPGAQAYVNSVVDELASWGVDYVKLDGITNSNVADIKAWSAAIKQSGRPMVLDTTQGGFNLDIASELKQYSNQWEFAPDIEASGPNEGGGSNVFPLTTYSHWSDRFDDVAAWQPYGGPGGFNDYDSIEVGDGPSHSGMSIAAEKSQLSLWALGSSPLILGSDLTRAVANADGSSSDLNPKDLGLLKNKRVVAVDQDSIDARRLSDDGTAQVFGKIERGGDAIVGLFDTNANASAANDTISISVTAMGLRKDSRGYKVQELWTSKRGRVASGGRITASVPPEGVALYRVTPR